MTKEHVFEIIFGTHSAAGRRFDICLIIAIFASVSVVILDSVTLLSPQYHRYFYYAEWFFTLLFTLEYVVRLYVSPKPKVYAFSFYGIIDLLSILPAFISLLFPGANYLMIIRIMRVLRIFRVLKLFRYLQEANTLFRSLLASKRKILVFLFCVALLIVVFGCLMYLIEGPENGFTSIPKSIYWAIVTITTVGYGDISPSTPLGQTLASITMLVGYSILAVPTGIITAELAQEMHRERHLIHCDHCDRSGHDLDAKFCNHCGTPLPPKEVES
ncbi:ion transporter [Motilimonas cestriensis]|uniref:Ion transporter n=1 Tax=Motilimonas cestriensis TaxID=2742685 RepID=A0ABS8W8W1_9GAMM|nr:ion transporter [Motilimonas cestriensis]MCE2594943.1 ion transporter [Motilimonas cestriensis]